jgi:putative oxidoreductase
MNRFLQTDEQSTGLFVQRIVLALVMLPHGAQKLLGWFGGYGFSGTMGFFTDTMHIPAPIAFLVILGESIGAVMLAFGLATRLSAFGISAIMLGAMLMTHAQHGFFMNWFGAQQGEGIEFHLLALALSLPLMIWGGGRYAVDSLVQRRLGPGVALAPARA